MNEISDQYILEALENKEHYAIDVGKRVGRMIRIGKRKKVILQEKSYQKKECKHKNK